MERRNLILHFFSTLLFLIEESRRNYKFLIIVLLIGLIYLTYCDRDALAFLMNSLKLHNLSEQSFNAKIFTFGLEIIYYRSP